MKSIRSQTATEYLIILAVVIIIALIVITTLGGIPAIGGGSIDNTMLAKWKTAMPISVNAWSSSPFGTSIQLVNSGNEILTITAIKLDNQSYSTSKQLGIGEKANFFVMYPYKAASQKYEYTFQFNYTSSKTGATFTFNNDELRIKGTATATESSPLFDGNLMYFRGDSTSSANATFTLSTASGSPTTTGLVRRANSFNLPTAAYLVNGTSHSLAGGFTVSLWANPTSGGNIISGAGFGAGSWRMIADGTAVVLEVSGNRVSASSYSGSWKNLVGVFNGSQIFLYIDGTLIGSNSTTAGGATSVYYLGTQQFGTPYDGYLADVLVWTRPFTATEISALNSEIYWYQ